MDDKDGHYGQENMNRHIVQNNVKSNEANASFLWVYKNFTNNWVFHGFLLIFLCVYTILGGLLFCVIEGYPESLRLKDIVKSRTVLITELKEIHDSSEVGLTGKALDDFNVRAFQLLRSYESQLVAHFENNRNILKAEHSGIKWEFWNALFFCGSIYTTIGYGNVLPVTYSGQFFTIAYACLGVPIFILFLADCGRMFTHSIKKIWCFLRRLFLSGSCKKKRPMIQRVQGLDSGEDLDLNDEYVPLTVILIILTVYLAIGAIIFFGHENWNFIESLYFVIISMLTIGLGDYVPENNIFLILALIYIIFGLALSSMCIQLTQELFNNRMKLDKHQEQRKRIRKAVTIRT